MGGTHGAGALKSLSALEGRNGVTPSGSVRLRGLIRGRRAPRACPCPRLLNVNPCRVRSARVPGGQSAIQATPAYRTRLIKPPALSERLTATIAWENYRARFDHVFGIESQGFSEGTYCALPEQPRNALAQTP